MAKPGNSIYKFVAARFGPMRYRFAQSTLLILLMAFGRPVMSYAQSTSLSVSDFGARGDAVQILVTTTINSSVVHFPATHPLASTDVGKIILLFGAGAATTPTNNEDLITSIVSVSNGTSITISGVAGLTSTQVPCTYGTQNADAFQRCIDASTGTNALVQIPAGNFLLVPPSQLRPSIRAGDYWNWRTSLVIQKGGLHFVGADRDATVLTGCGAWDLYSGEVQRGFLFLLKGPITNDAPLIFENLTMDGGVQMGNTTNRSFPANINDGSGWDVTHDAVVDGGTPPLHGYKLFQNCNFVHWRGEMVKSVVSFDSGMIVVTNCSFIDGAGSGYNFNWTPHHITGCLFSNLDVAMEYYVGTMQSPSLFENSTISQVRGGIGLVGALSNSATQPYTIRSNEISPSQYGVLFGPARNVTVTGNQFLGGYLGLSTDSSAYQGSGWNSNILVESNSFAGTAIPFSNGGGGQDSIENVVIRGNSAWGCNFFASGYGWGSNIVFLRNYSQQTNANPACLRSDQLTGQYFMDDLSNDFPPEVTTNKVGQTNVITYAHGMRHQVSTGSSQSGFVLDDTKPALIPVGASLQVENIGQIPARIQFSSTNPGSSVMMLTNGQKILCMWTNGNWYLRPPAPRNFRVLGQ